MASTEAQRKLAKANRKRHANEDIRLYVVVIAAGVEAYYRMTHGVWLAAPLIVGAGFFIFFTLTPRAMRPLAQALMFLVHRVGKFNNMVVMWVLFFGIFTPLGYVVRRLKLGKLDLHAGQPRDSYWKERASEERDVDFTKMY